MSIRPRWPLILCICLAAQASAAAPSVCVHPDLDAFLDRSRPAIQFQGTFFPSPAATYLPLEVGGQRLQWMGVSWGSFDGALFVLDCAGNRLAALPLGYLQRLRPGPSVPGLGQTLEVVYTSTFGSGVRNNTVKLVAFFSGSLTVLWSHDESGLLATWERGEYDDTYSWRYLNQGTIIEISGTRAVGDFKEPEHGWAPHSTHALPAETYCWKDSDKSYKPCGGK